MMPQVMSVTIVVLLVFVTCTYSIDTVNEGLGEKISRVFMQQASKDRLLFGANIQSTSSLKVNALIALSGRASYGLGHGIEVAIKKAVEDMCSIEDDQQQCTLDVQYFDTQSSPDEALSLFQQGYRDGVRIFIGLITSGEAKAVAEYASTHAQDAVIISPSSTATELCKYKELYRLTMDDRGFAEALYDMFLEMASKYTLSNLPVYVMHLEDLHGKGLVSDIEEVFEERNADFDSLHAISYSGNHESARNALSKLSTATANTQYAIIVLTGLQPSDAAFILNESKKFNRLNKQFMWVVSDMIALSDLSAPAGMALYGLNYRGSLLEGLSRKSLSQKHSLMNYLDAKGVPPMVQPLLAYDAVSLVYQAKSGRENNKVGFQFEKQYQGVTGTVDFSSCHERASGQYSLSMKKSKDNLESAVLAKGWIFLAHYKINVLESSEEAFQMERGHSYSSRFNKKEVLPNMATMAEDIARTRKVDITLTHSGTAAIYRSELMHALQIANSIDCQKSATIVVSTRDDASSYPISSTYSLSTFPEVLAIPAQYGFIVQGSCVTHSEKIEVVKVCPSASVAGTELTCTIKRSHTSKNEVMAQQFTMGLGVFIGAVVCFVGAAICTGVTTYIAGIASPICVGVGNGCGSLVNVVSGGALNLNAYMGGKYVCTELFRQGYMSPELMLADMNFALTYTKEHPIIREGYNILGPFVASLMKDSETITDIARYIAIPWAEEMAYHEGYRSEGNEFGGWVMSIGSVVCGIVGGVYTYSYAIGIAIEVLVLVLIGVYIYKKFLWKHIKND